MKVQVRIKEIVILVVVVACNRIEASQESTPKLPKLVNLEGWRSDGQSPDQVFYSKRSEGETLCNR